LEFGLYADHSKFVLKKSGSAVAEFLPGSIKWNETFMRFEQTVRWMEASPLYPNGNFLSSFLRPILLKMQLLSGR